jgi:putative addiction module component (TIGR02574 family)
MLEPHQAYEGGPPVSSAFQALGIHRLSVKERIALVQEIWDSIAAVPEQLPVTEALRQELERRLTAHQANPRNVIPWEQVKRRASPLSAAPITGP